MSVKLNEDESNNKDQIDIPSSRKNSKSRNNISSTLPLGICFGVAFGIIFDQLTMGISLGVCFGVVLGALTKKK